MPRWAVSLLGAASLIRSGAGEVRVPTASWPIVGYLLTCPGNRSPRTALAGRLWPDQNEESARHCLATALWRFNRGLGESAGPVVADSDNVVLHEEVWADVLAFQRRASIVEARRPAPLALTRRRLRTALRLYAGDYLPGYDADWLALERERLRCLHLDTLYSLAHVEVAMGDWHSVVGLTRRLCAAEPLREDAQRLLMEGYARTGNRGMALRQYRICADILARELGVEPMPETIELERRLSSGAPQPLTPRRIDEDSSRMLEALTATREHLKSALRTVDRGLVSDARE